MGRRGLHSVIMYGWTYLFQDISNEVTEQETVKVLQKASLIFLWAGKNKGSQMRALLCLCFLIYFFTIIFFVAENSPA